MDVGIYPFIDITFNCKFVQKRKVIMLCNCDSSGVLIDLKTPAKYLECKPWVLLSVREFEVFCNDKIDE